MILYNWDEIQMFVKLEVTNIDKLTKNMSPHLLTMYIYHIHESSYNI